MKTPADADATPVAIEIDITWDGSQPTYVFSGPNVGEDGTIDLSGVADAADIRFSLVSQGGEMFDREHAIAVAPMRNPRDCPQRGSGHGAPVFDDPSVDDARRGLSIRDHNGANSGTFKYALFLTDRDNRPIPPCDPRIINR